MHEPSEFYPTLSSCRVLGGGRYRKHNCDALWIHVNVTSGVFAVKCQSIIIYKNPHPF